MSNSITSKELSDKLARAVFECGDGPRPCRRIQFMGGELGNEIGQGGLAEKPLADLINETLIKLGFTSIDL